MKTKMIALALVAALGGCGDPDDTSGQSGVQRINHLVVIYLENHSFDNLYGQFAGAEGLAQAPASGTMIQNDMAGTAYATLPQPWDTSMKMADARFPANKTVYETASILTFIEHRWNLPSLGGHDAKAADLAGAFDFTQKP